MLTLDISAVWRAIKRRLLLILLLTIFIVGLTGWLSFYVIQPQFEATSTLLVQSRNASPGSRVDYNDLMANQELVMTYRDIIMSGRIAQDVIDTLHLSTTPKELLEKIDVQTKEESLLTAITVRDGDPEQAANIANAFAQSFYRNLPLLMKIDNVSILDRATVQPNRVPVFPKPYVNLSVAFVLSIVIGVCLALFLEMVDRTVKSEEDVEALLGLPVLGVVLHDRKKGRKKKTRRKKRNTTVGGESFETERENREAVLPR